MLMYKKFNLLNKNKQANGQSKGKKVVKMMGVKRAQERMKGYYGICGKQSAKFNFTIPRDLLTYDSGKTHQSRRG